MTETIYGNEVPSNLDLSDNDSLTLGTRFVPLVDGHITHARWRFPTTTPSSTVQVFGGLYRNFDSALLDSVGFPLNATPGQWNTVAYTTPIAVFAGFEYTAAIWTPDKYVAASGSYPWPKTSTGGNVITDSTIAGRYTYPSTGGLSFPASQYNSNTYFADIVFEPTAPPPSGPTFKLWNGSAEVDVTAKLWNGTSEVALSLSSIT